MTKARKRTNRPRPNFKKDLERGKRGEALLVEHCHLSLQPNKDPDERRWDYESASGLKVEIKSDYWPTSTGNFFMEFYSDIARKKPGGPWRAYQDEVDVFIYFYPKERVYYYFRNIEALCERLNQLLDKFDGIVVHNTRWQTLGYKVPREELADLFEVYEWDSKST